MDRLPPLILTLMLAFLVNHGESARIQPTDNTTPTIKIGNSGLKCYHCADSSCDKPLQTSNLRVQTCSELTLPNTIPVDSDVSNISYTCIKVSGKANTEFGCSFTNVNNRDVCDVYKELAEGLGKILKYFVQKLGHSTATPQNNASDDSGIQCSTCNTDLCNTV